MEIKTPFIRTIESTIILLIIIAIGIPTMIFSDGLETIKLAFVFFYALSYFVPSILFTGRKFVLKQDGIYIYLFNLLLYKYSWSEIKSKYHIVKDVGIHRETVVFYHKKISYKLATILCKNYMAPLSLVYINVVDDTEKYMGENLKHKVYYDQDVYLANQENFWGKMEEWNISLEKCVYNREAKNRKIYEWSLLGGHIILLCVIAFLIIKNLA